MSDELKMLIGKKVHRVIACNGFSDATAILFDDGKTFIHLEEQDVSFHDCSPSARNMYVTQNEKDWQHYNTLNDAKELC
jgi:hypothetical protein